MIDVSNMKAPGWQRVVADLVTPVHDDRAFLVRLLGVLGQVAGAKQAVLFLVPPSRDDDPAGVTPTPMLTWPFAASGADAQGRPTVRVEVEAVKDEAIEQAAEVKAAARSAASSRVAKIYSQETGDQLYDASQSRGYVLAIPVPGTLPGPDAIPTQACAVITLLTESRSRQAMQTTLAIAEIVAGFAHGHFAQQSLRRTQAASAALDLAGRLLASINSTTGFKGCTLQLVNDMVRALGVDRVAFGWVAGARSTSARGTGDEKRSTRCVALSDTENLDRRMTMVQSIEAAMDECLDQEQPVLYPPPPEGQPGSDVLLSQAVTHAHRELGSRDARLRIASFPLRLTDRAGQGVVGVLLVETSNPAGLDLAQMELLQATLDLIAPVLQVRFSDDRMLGLRAWDTMVKAAAWAVGPRHTAWKLGGIAVLIATLAAVFVHTPYRVGAPFELVAEHKRVISAPYDGVIATLSPGVEAGRRIEKDAVLFELDTTDRRLSLLEATSQVVQYDKQADESLRKGELAEAEQFRLRAEQVRARQSLLTHEISRSRVTSPLSGMIVAGEMRDRVGSSVKLGDRLLEIADLKDLALVAKVSDRDIALIEPGQTGEMAPKSGPSLSVPVTVDRIVPLAQPEEGDNAFEVYCSFPQGAPDWFRPGMEGEVKFNGPRKSLGWIASRRVLDTLRIWLWW